MPAETETDYLELELLLAQQAREMGRDHERIIRKMRALSPQLLAAYLATDYIANLDGQEIIMNIAKAVPGLLTERIRQHAVPGWAVITAYNPHTGMASAADNAARQQLLGEVLALHGYETHPAVGRGKDGQWEEPSILIVGIGYELAGAIGSSFQQNAVVFGQAGAAAELVFCEQAGHD